MNSHKVAFANIQPVLNFESLGALFRETEPIDKQGAKPASTWVVRVNIDEIIFIRLVMKVPSKDPQACI